MVKSVTLWCTGLIMLPKPHSDNYRKTVGEKRTGLSTKGAQGQNPGVRKYQKI